MIVLLVACLAHGVYGRRVLAHIRSVEQNSPQKQEAATTPHRAATTCINCSPTDPTAAWQVSGIGHGSVPVAKKPLSTRPWPHPVTLMEEQARAEVERHADEKKVAEDWWRKVANKNRAAAESQRAKTVLEQKAGAEAERHAAEKKVAEDWWRKVAIQNSATAELKKAKAFQEGQARAEVKAVVLANSGTGADGTNPAAEKQAEVPAAASVIDSKKADEGAPTQSQSEAGKPTSHDFDKILNEEEYNSLIEKSTKENRVEVIIFTATWCRTCKAMVPKLKRLAAKFSQYDFHEVDFDTNKALVRKLGIKSLPNIRVLPGSRDEEPHTFTCGRGKIYALLKILESYGDVEETHRSPDELALPKVWEPYLTNVEEAGAGNFGKVFSMDLTCPDSNVTKVAMKNLASDKNNKRLLQNEMAAGIALKEYLLSDERDYEEDVSSYCVPLLAEAVLVEGNWYMPMPFSNQGDLSGIYENSTKRELFGGDEGMYGFLLHVAKGVRALHRAGWVHNDLHGRNALVNCNTEDVPSSCFASIIDLGLASRMDTKLEGARGYRYSISPESIAMGYEENYPNPKSDVWELGMLLWEVRFGQDSLPTRKAADLDAVMELIPTLDFKEAPFPELENEPEVRNLLRGMLTQDVSERWDIDKVIAELDKLALPAMRGPHESAWLNTGCLVNPFIPEGSIVEIYGLRSQSAQHLNGKSGEVVKHHAAQGIYEVKLTDGEVMNVPGIRIRLIE